MLLSSLPLTPTLCIIQVNGTEFVALFNPLMRAFLSYQNGAFTEKFTLDLIDKWTILPSATSVTTPHFRGSCTQQRTIEKLIKAINGLPSHKALSPEVAKILTELDS